MLNRLMMVIGGLLVSSAAFAEEATEAASSGNGLAAAIAIGIAAFGGAIGQGWTASSALTGIARNPQANLFVPMIIGLALIESLVIYALLIAFQLAG